MRYPSNTKWTITSTFQDHLNDPTRSSFPGTDYAGYPMWGDQILAPESGTLDIYRDGNGTIYAVVVDTPSGYRWDFLHVQSVNGVTTNNPRPIIESEEIAPVGNTGYVLPAPTPQNPYSGTHVHVSIRDSEGNFLDPEPILEQLWNEMQNPTIPDPNPCAEKDTKIDQLSDEIVKLQTRLSQNDIEINRLKFEAVATQELISSKDETISRLNGELFVKEAYIKQLETQGVVKVSLWDKVKKIIASPRDWWFGFVDSTFEGETAIMNMIRQFLKFTFIEKLIQFIAIATVWFQSYSGDNAIVKNATPFVITFLTAASQYLFVNFGKSKE